MKVRRKSVDTLQNSINSYRRALLQAERAAICNYLHAVQDRVITKDKQLIGDVVTLKVNVEKVAQHKQ